MSSILLPFTGRLLFLTSTSKTSTGKDVDHCIDNGTNPIPRSTTCSADASATNTVTMDTGTKISTGVAVPKSEAIIDVESSESEVVPLATNTSPSAENATAATAVSLTPPQAPPKVGSTCIIISGNTPFMYTWCAKFWDLP